MLGGNITKTNRITYHHLVKRCNGGGKSFRNGALVSAEMHRRMNFIEFKDITFYNNIQNYFQCYKGEEEETRELLKELAYQDVNRRYNQLIKEYPRRAN